jgi:hypothetical protein
MTVAADEIAQASNLADRMLALLELDMPTAERFFADRVSDGDFGDSHPRYFWRATVEQTDIDGLGLVTLEILHQDDDERAEQIENARVVRSLRLLKADPGRIDLAEDFGFDEEQIAQFGDLVPIPGFDPSNLDPQQLASLDPAQLLEMLPALMQLMAQITGGQLPPEFAEGGIPTPEEMQKLFAEQLADRLDGDKDPNRGGGVPPGRREIQREGGDGGGRRPSTPGGSGGRAGARGDRGGGGRGEAPVSDPGGRGGGGAGRGGRGGSGGAGRGDSPLRLEDLDRLRDEVNNQPRGRSGDKGGGSGRGGG